MFAQQATRQKIVHEWKQRTVYKESCLFIYNKFFQIRSAVPETMRQEYVIIALSPPGPQSLVRLFACPLSVCCWACGSDNSAQRAAAAACLGDKRKLHVLLHFQRNVGLDMIVCGNLSACCSQSISQFSTLHVCMDFIHRDTRLPKVSTLGWNVCSSSHVVTAMSTCHWQGPGSCIGANMALVRYRYSSSKYCFPITFTKRTVLCPLFLQPLR